MNKRIEKKIVGYKVTTQEQAKEAAAGVAAKEAESNIIQMHEKVSRPEALAGSTYKIKTPMSDHALYLTINDIVLNEGTDHELRRPFEVFINSKNMDHFQWIVALTRVLSAVFRKGGDCTFLVEELKAVLIHRVVTSSPAVNSCRHWLPKLAGPSKIICKKSAC